ncbi:hypothetical protein AM571_PC01335 (plasmid) [Rhizobium etli 8C-3]|uniref:Uncharacterized protein n=1 Tax=Rhizobium etli 8C-3 TaxID=538025 RepID=A0A1L5PFS0_RHIET|nr:hypothetical protein AM571_PC01335 [Rhizobium etli 8C-3]
MSVFGVEINIVWRLPHFLMPLLQQTQHGRYLVGELLTAALKMVCNTFAPALSTASAIVGSTP